MVTSVCCTRCKAGNVLFDKHGALAAWTQSYCTCFLDCSVTGGGINLEYTNKMRVDELIDGHNHQLLSSGNQSPPPQKIYIYIFFFYQARLVHDTLRPKSNELCRIRIVALINTFLHQRPPSKHYHTTLLPRQYKTSKLQASKKLVLYYSVQQ